MMTLRLLPRFHRVTPSPCHRVTSSLLHLVTLSLLIAAPALAADEPLTTLTPFLKQHCYECHGAKKQENDKRFDIIGADLADARTLSLWQGILDQLNMGDMPPEDTPQPAAEETAQVIEILTARLKVAYAARRSTGAQTVARRLNRFELRNTVRDLLYINDPELRIGNVARLVDNNGNGSVENTSTDPFRSFPADEVEEGFDNIGDRLVMSDFLLRLMLDAAEESLAIATETGPRPNVETRRFAGHLSKQGTGDLERYARELFPAYDALYRAGTLTADQLRGGVGTSARYRITFEVSGHNQHHPWAELIPADQDTPLLLTLCLAKNGSKDGEQIELAQWELPGDGRMSTFTIETWIDKQWTPQLTWQNGPFARTDQLLQKFLPEAFKPAPDKSKIPKEQHKEAQDAWAREMAVTLLNNYQGPSVRIHSLTLEPLIDQWPPQSHTALYGDVEARSRTRQSLADSNVADGQSLATSATEEAIESLLRRFAERAFRRPVTDEELEPYVALVRAQVANEDEPNPSVIQGLTYQAYEGSWTNLPDFSKLTPTAQGELANGLVDLRAATKDEHFGIVFRGKVNAAKAGEYQFHLASDDGARVLIDGKKVAEHDGLHGAERKQGNAQLAAGAHDIRVEYFAYGKPNSLQVAWSGPGFAEAALAVGQAPAEKPVDVDAQTAEFIKAMQLGYTAILCSPDFLYLQEKPGRLDNYAVAARLSFFLWSSMPDERLFELAQAGKLTDEAVLQQQVDRMLDDPKSAAFMRHFPERWLRLDKIAESPPELNGPFRVYWDRKLEPQILAQTTAYFTDIVKTNGPIRQFIDSDYTYLNEAIASVFYGRDDVQGDFLRKVPTSDRRRGGIFTQPSVMTSTANGVDTSPVVRGVWVLENVLGTPPSPPPPDVEPLSPDLRNARTIREQLAVHRDQQACNSCHRKIDPLGFAFENFDPIGRWREKYPQGGANIDASSTMASGKEIADIVAFKAMLLTREKEITRCLAEKLLTYSSGRVLEPIDRGEVDGIVAAMEKQNGGLRDLIKLVVQSDVFLTK